MSDEAGSNNINLTSFAAGGGCACKIPAGELESAVEGLIGKADPNVLVGLDDGDDAAAVKIQDGLAVEVARWSGDCGGR